MRDQNLSAARLAADQMRSGREEAAIQRDTWAARQGGISYSSDIVGGAMEVDEYGRNYPSNFRFIDGGPAAADAGGNVTLKLSDEIASKVARVRKMDRFINDNYDEAGLWHDVKDVFGAAKPITPAELRTERAAILGEVSEAYSYLKISNASPLDQARAGSDFAYLPNGASINESNFGNMRNQLSVALSNPDLTQEERLALNGAYNDVYQRGNRERLLSAELDKHVIEFTLAAALMTEQGGRPNVSITTLQKKTPFVPYRRPEVKYGGETFGEYSQRSYGPNSVKVTNTGAPRITASNVLQSQGENRLPPTSGASRVVSTAEPGSASILRPESSLSARLMKIHEQLPEPGAFATFRKRSVSMSDLREIGRVTGDEYNMFTKMGNRLVVRGEGSIIRVSEEMYLGLKNGEYGKFSGHTHPPGSSLIPGPADRPFLGKMQQDRSGIWGDNFDPSLKTSNGHFVFGFGLADDARIAAQINRTKMIKLYGGQ